MKLKRCLGGGEGWAWGGRGGDPGDPGGPHPEHPLPPQIAVTFAIVLGVIIYRISTAAALAMNSSPSVRSNIRVTVTATAVIINLVVIILLDEVYGCIARWLTKIGERPRPGRASRWGPWAGHPPSLSPVAMTAERSGPPGPRPLSSASRSF